MFFVKLSAWVLLAIIALVAAAWLSAVLFLGFSGAEPIAHARPWTLYSYAYWHGANPKIDAWLYLSGFLALAALAAPLLLLLPKGESLHGDARWLRNSEVAKAGFFSNDGIIVGELNKKLLRHGGSPMISPHVFLAAPTGSGKTQAVMLPNVLTWPGSLVALDVKGELYDASAGYRAAHGQSVFRINFTPRDYRTHQFNPFAFVSSDPNFVVADVQRITNYLIQLGKGDDFWPQEARRLFIMLALYTYSVGETPTLPRLRELALVGGDGTGLHRWCKAVAGDPAKLAKLHRESAMSIVNFASSADNTVAGVVQTMVSGLTPFLNELTAAVVSGNSVDLAALRERATSVYLVVQPADIEQLSPVIRLFFQQLVDLNTDVEFSKNPKYKFLLLLGMDEFATIGKVPAIQLGISFMRSYGLRLLALIQSPSQLQTVYQADGAKSFIDNFGCGVHFTPGAEDLTAAQNLEKLLGYRTVKGHSRTQRGGLTFDDKSRSETATDQKRALMLYQDILRMSARESIILCSALHPIKAVKLFAAKDQRFAARMIAPPTVPILDVQAASAKNTAVEVAPIDITDEDNEMIPLYNLDDISLDLSDLPPAKDPVTVSDIEHICNLILDKAIGQAPALAV